MSLCMQVLVLVKGSAGYIKSEKDWRIVLQIVQMTALDPGLHVVALEAISHIVTDSGMHPSAFKPCFDSIQRLLNNFKVGMTSELLPGHPSKHVGQERCNVGKGHDPCLMGAHSKLADCVQRQGMASNAPMKAVRSEGISDTPEKLLAIPLCCCIWPSVDRASIRTLECL